MPAFQHIPLSIIEPIELRHIAQSGALLNNVPVWDGTRWFRSNPVAAFQAGAYQGRVSEINITGSATSTVVGDRMNINVTAGQVNVNGQPVTAINPGANMSASISGGIATLNAPSGSTYSHPAYSPFSFEPFISGNNIVVPAIYTDGIGSAYNVIGRFLALPSSGGSISLNQTGIGAPIIVSPGTASAFSLKGLVGVNGISVQDFGNYLQINGSGVGGSYTHPSYTPQTFTPTLIGNTLTVHSITTDSIGSVTSISPVSFALPSSGGGGGIAGISLNGVGSYTNINFGSGFSVSGNTVTATGGGHTIGNGGLGAGIVSLPGFAASHTLKGLVGSGSTTVTDMGSHILIASTGGGGGSLVTILKDGTFIGQVGTLNFKGAGVTVTSGAGIEVTIPSAGGGAGVSFFNGTTGAIQLIDGANTTVQNLGSGIFRINASGSGGGGVLTGTSGNGLTVGTNSVSMALATFGTAGAMIGLNGNVSNYLAGNGTWQPVPTGGGGGVTSVFSGAPSVLSVTPNTGAVTITPIGFGGVFTPAFNAATKTLSLPNHTLSNGITSNIGTTFVDLSGALNLPPATTNDFLRYNGTSWAASNLVKFNPSNTNGDPVFYHRDGSSSKGLTFTAGSTGIFHDLAFLYGYNTATIIAPYIELFTNGDIGRVFFNVGSGTYETGADLVTGSIIHGKSGSKLGFFGKYPIPRPSTTNDITSVRNALIALGLIS